MGIRPRAGRLMAVVLAGTVGWSVWATCAEAAALTAPEQMACCKNGQHTCGHHGSPAECCKTARQANPSTTAVHQGSPSAPLVALDHAVAPEPVTIGHVWHPHPLTDTWSPPGTKHPTYLVLSILRL